MYKVKMVLENKGISYNESIGGIIIHNSNVSYDLRHDLAMVGAELFQLDTTVYIHMPKPHNKPYYRINGTAFLEYADAYEYCLQQKVPSDKIEKRYN